MYRLFILLTLAGLGVNGDYCTPQELYNAANAMLNTFEQRIKDGISVKPPGFDQAINTPLITLPGNFVLNLGLVTLPLDLGCSQSGTGLKLTCRLGNIDCTYVHNKYGGQCGLSSNPVNGTAQVDGPVFVCNEQKPTNISFTDVSAQCGDLLGPLLDPLLDLALKNGVRFRMSTDLCKGTTDSIGCNIDCRNNHQYASGLCSNNETAVATFAGESNPSFQCTCAL